MTHGITLGKAYTPGDRLRFAAVFLGATLAALLIPVGYCRWLRII
jgi:hypothetical protein